MSLIYIADRLGRQVSYEAQEAQRLWRSGVIPRDALYWREGMTEWRSAVECFDPSSVPPPVNAPPPPIPIRAQRGFDKDPTRLTRWLLGFLWAYIGIAALASLVAVILMVTGQAGVVDPDNLTVSDVAGLLVGLPQMLIVLTTGILFLIWIHRANRNARGLGARGMTFSPGWSVGWYFVPIANLWKPYQAMKEIWLASADPLSWQSKRPPALLAHWWTLWIISSVLSNASFRISMRADTSAELVASEVVALLSNLLDVPLCLLAMRLVRDIMRHQNHWAAQAEESACSICRQPMPFSEMICLRDSWICARCKPIAMQQIREGIPCS